MKVFKTYRTLQKWRGDQPKRLSLGFVPTMGALHEGHLSLIRKAKRECSKVLVSIFVNPTQFAPHEDLAAYPRPLSADLSKLRNEGVHFVFCPKSDRELYPEGSDVQVRPRQKLLKVLEGPRRPGHFEGVATVVLKLFHLVQPQRAYFGEKDYQQLKVIEALVQDLFLAIKIRPCPIVREKSGLALSSRNQYFSKDDRQASAQLYEVLKTSAQISEAKARLQRLGFGVEYLECWQNDLEKPSLDEKGRWLVAAQFRGVRLIDNLIKK